MWSIKLGKKLNLDVFNLGMGASGVDYQFYNTILFQNFILEKKKLPKLVVYQWPMSFRTSAFFKFKEDNKTEDSRNYHVNFDLLEKYINYTPITYSEGIKDYLKL